jgi:hypothetical protein
VSAVIELRMADVQALRLGTSGLETLRSLAGPKARPLGQDRTAEYALLALAAADAYPGMREVTREFVFLPRERALVEYDIAIAADPPEPVTWRLVGTGNAESLLPQRKPSSETEFLHLIQMGERQTPGKIESDDLAGLRLAQWAILFYTEPRMALSAVSFEVDGPARMNFLIAGLAPGAWEIWRAGMREQEDGAVRPGSGVLSFEGKPGSYFLRAV